VGVQDGLARRTGRSKSFYVRAALHEYLTDLEDVFAADAAIDAFDAGGRTWSSAVGGEGRDRRVTSRSSVETTDQFDRDDEICLLLPGFIDPAVRDWIAVSSAVPAMAAHPDR